MSEIHDINSISDLKKNLLKILDIKNYDIIFKQENNGVWVEIINIPEIKPYTSCVARFFLGEFPGCCGICISTGTIVHSEYRGKGIAQKLIELKKFMARELNFTIMIATVAISYNEIEKHILEKTGWKKLDMDFVNRKTTNTVATYFLPLWQEGK
jgi:GNAT superfamily N-acetyltransferase